MKELKKYPDNVVTFIDLKAGRLDAIVIDEISARYYITKKSKEVDAYKIIDDKFPSSMMAVGLRKSDTELQAQLQKVLDDMKKDGTSAKISKEWFGEDLVL